MSRIRVCFFGTPDFAVTCLKRMLNDEHYEIVGVVTQPDRPAGRKLVLTPSPVKQFCLEHGLRVMSPETVNKKTIREEIESWGAEVAVVVAFGQILSTNLLNSFRLGCVNVHASLLPRWRGAAPIQRAIEAGDKLTGVCLQIMVRELDAGDVLGAREFEIDDVINSLELHDRLAVLGADLLQVELMDYVRGNLAPVAQDSSHVTYAKKIEKSESELRWSECARSLHNKVRAFVWGPGTYTTLKANSIDGGGAASGAPSGAGVDTASKKLKIHKTRVVSEGQKVTRALGQFQVVKSAVGETELHVQCADGVLALIEVQPESRNRMSVADFIKGQKLEIGSEGVFS